MSNLTNEILAIGEGYLEGRAFADLNILQKNSSLQLQMQWEMLTDEQKQRVIGNLQTQARARSKRRKAFWGGALGGLAFIILIGVVGSMSDKSVRNDRPTSTSISAEDKALCGTTYPSWSRDASNKEIYTCDNGKTWWRSRSSPK